MQQVASNAQTNTKLPNMAFSVQLTDPCQIICITNGQNGYFQSKRFNTAIEAAKYADSLNNYIGVTPSQREAMIIGSMFGWHVRAADPNSKMCANARPLVEEIDTPNIATSSTMSM